MGVASAGRHHAAWVARRKSDPSVSRHRRLTLPARDKRCSPVSDRTVAIQNPTLRARIDFFRRRKAASFFARHFTHARRIID
jgi:hypothetical protein